MLLLLLPNNNVLSPKAHDTLDGHFGRKGRPR
jgi:hypothetical protein